MSLIDKQLTDTLVRIGINFNKKFAQINPDISNLQLLVSNLEKEVVLELDPNQQVDSLPQNINPQFPTNSGNIPLIFLDLQNNQSFNNWLNRNDISLQLGDKKVMINHPEFDPSLIVKVLLQRANILLNKATNDELKDIYTNYINLLKNLSFTPLSPERITTDQRATNISQDKSSQEEKQDQEQKKVISQLFSQLPNSLPFNSNTIEFAKIREFFEIYSQIFSQNKDEKQQRRVQSLTQSIAQAEQAMEIASSGTKTNMQSFPMNRNVSPAQVKSWLKAPEGQYYLSVLENLSNVITLTYNVLRDLSLNYGKSIGESALNNQFNIFNVQFNSLRVLQENVK